MHPLLRRARVAKTILVLPHPDLAVSGVVRLPGRELRLEGARGGQAHLWGTKHAGRWAWAHANDFAGLDGVPRTGAYLDGVSVIVPRLGRDVGPEHAGRRATCSASRSPRRRRSGSCARPAASG